VHEVEGGGSRPKDPSDCPQLPVGLDFKDFADSPAADALENHTVGSGGVPSLIREGASVAGHGNPTPNAPPVEPFQADPGLGLEVPLEQVEGYCQAGLVPVGEVEGVHPDGLGEAPIGEYFDGIGPPPGRVPEGSGFR